MTNDNGAARQAANGAARRSPSLPEALRQAGIGLKSHKDGQHRARCPCCDRGKQRPDDIPLTVRLDGTGATFYCFRCGWKGGLWPCLDCGGFSPSRVCDPCQRGRDGRAADARPQRQPAPPPKIKRPPPEPRPPGDLQAALRLYGSCRPIEADTPAARYLIARGCALPENDVRWHPHLRHPCGHVGPALVALVTDAVTCAPLTVHRTWIRADGSKAAVKPCRLLWPGLPKRGGVIRLVEDAEVTLGLAIAEGLETALTTMRAFRHCWSCIDAGNLGAFPVLAGIDALTIVEDHDPAGQAAARTCADRWLAAGGEVWIWRAPAEGQDFNDIARRKAS
jgi:putative DNA primase/helicase